MVVFKVLKFIFGAISFFLFLTFIIGLIIIGYVSYKGIDAIIEDNENNDGKWINKFIEFKDRFDKEDEQCLLGGKYFPCEDVRNIGK